MAENSIVIIGGGLAGSEAAWQIANAGGTVELHEMRPTRMTGAHTTGYFSELVCSNSLGSETENSASRILKDEMERMGSFVLKTAREHRVPAGASLAVDRGLFAQAVTAELSQNPRIRIHRQEITALPEGGITILATGPLTTQPLCEAIGKRVGEQSLYFYDAISPIVSAESLDRDQMFVANRYGKGESADFLNIPLTETQYDHFVDELLRGECMLPHDFEEEKYFEGCMPIEAIASRGRRTLAFGPMKPVGLIDPKTGRRAFATIQLRAENRYFSAYNLVGFQTKLKYSDQQRIFRQLPGLGEAEFLRLGSMHRNTYLDSPRVLRPTLQLRNDGGFFIAGQLTGTEGYLESAATGLVAGMNALRLSLGKQTLALPTETILGSLLATITDEKRDRFQPMNVNMGLLPPVRSEKKKIDRQTRNLLMAQAARQVHTGWMHSIGFSGS